MYGATPEVIEAWKTEGLHKSFSVVIGNTSYNNDYIVDDSFSLKQAILDSENFEAIGCIASSFTVELRAQFSTKQKDKHIQVFVSAGNTQNIQIFDGYISKCTKTANGWRRQIEAYDYFYTMSGQSGNGNDGDKKQFDVTEWYNDLAPTSTSSLLNMVCSKYGLPVRTGNKPLVNGSLLAHSEGTSKASALSALDLIKSIMQLNGCFGYITGDGYFSWKYLEMPTSEGGWLYPSAFLFPEGTIYPGYDPDRDDRTPESAKNFIGEYESLEYQDFKMLPINKVVVRDHEKDEHKGEARTTEVSSDENSYIIQGNLLVLGAAQDVKEQAAKNVFDVLNSTWYVPFTSDQPALPYIECGDEVNFYDFIDDYGQASLQRFFILSRTMTGGQHLKDNWAANGDEYQHEFVTGTASDPGLKEELEKEMDEKIEAAAGLYNIVSVGTYTDIPDPPSSHTLYCVQGYVQFYDPDEGYDPEPEPETNQNEGE